MRQESKWRQSEEKEMWLSVKPGSHYFWQGERPFFWLGDTAWLMFHELNRQEIERYLTNRAQKGFRVIQIVAVHHLPAKNFWGKEAFFEDCPARPRMGEENGYWELVDWTLEKAREKGLYVAMLPHWGNLSNEFSMDEMEQYVKFLAKRYGHLDNLLWVTGGDIKADEREAYWKSMGQLLRKMCPRQIISYHPFGRTSSVDYFPEEEWMDFHMFQSGHRRYDQRSLNDWDDTGESRYYGEDNWRYVQDGWNLKRKMPILDGEPSYEHIPQGLHLEKEPYWTPEQVRRYGWWSVLAGAAGFTYGHNSIMQFYRGKGSGAFFVKYHWEDALHSPACAAVAKMAEFIQGIFNETSEKAKELGENPVEYMEQNCGSCVNLLIEESAWSDEQKEERIMAWKIGEYHLFYSYTGKAVQIYADKNYDAWWLDPENGVQSWVGQTHNEKTQGETVTFQPPKGDFSHGDWLLVLKERV